MISLRVRNIILSVILGLAILGAVGMLCYVIATPGSTERFTEFYILGPGAKAADYLKQLEVGQEDSVIVGIVNREQETVSYLVEVTIDEVTNNELGPVTLEYDEKWEGMLSFTPNRVGNNQKVEFLLYRQGQNEAYQELHLWVNVIEAEELSY